MRAQYPTKHEESTLSVTETVETSQAHKKEEDSDSEQEIPEAKPKLVIPLRYVVCVAQMVYENVIFVARAKRDSVS